MTTGYLEGLRTPESLSGAYYFFMFNGNAAVSFFFVLSGFVLCWSYFNDGDQHRLVKSFVKRFPRLVFIVTVTTVLSYFLFYFGLYHFVDAGLRSGSPWLASFGGAGWTPGFEPGFLAAFAQGVTTFFTGLSSYNANLWTMKPEFFGSMIVYMLAGFISIVLGRRYLNYSFVILSISSLGYNPLIFPFVLGVFLSVRVAQGVKPLPLPVCLSLIVFGLYLLGYVIPEEHYAWASLVPGSVAGTFRTSLHALGSGLIIYATLSNERLFKSMTGRAFVMLGKISFPLYLVHTLVICSLSSVTYVALSDAGWTAPTVLILVFAVTLAASVAASWPLSRLDDWWVAAVNRASRKLLTRPEAA
jgi:peptidoglycan/LPS O-acetylase OafA/YrhL